MSTDAPIATPTPPSNPTIRFLVDWGGPLCFMAAYFVILARTHSSTQAMMHAPWALAGGSIAAVVLGFAAERRVAPVPLAAAVVGVLVSGLTLIFHNPIFVFMKPTIINLGLAVALLGGLAWKRLFLKSLFAGSVQMTDVAWRTLTIRYVALFVVLAIVNEVVWRTQGRTFWVLFHFIGPLVLTVLFSISQMPFILKQARALEAAAELEG